ncbi:hypothetical protein, conserved [Trypanosoma brucei gambiense DAL972]|uniref:Fungal lipase-type domain-containing protein n=1 Tax=Trypanosoma brucei gambiense (strain MHOM/CI/86/DAL972) TaxID=679716 RepID=C9ZMW5_TRYB9|nr:hypothetical protein, conserved [Trypanosoma brucei gambiense DAL972]CBH10618.1 hypothetical protein, conserved [Trypanosoma brucei gambiense DAL972]|eukprot:XP_011772907.1 hypothetical protein, conserved [Trypanosoma brucei gambiense DAL972]
MQGDTKTMGKKKTVSSLNETRERRHLDIGKVRDVWNTFQTAMWHVCLPNELVMCFDPLLRCIFALYYLPPVALVVAITHSALARIVWVLVTPVAQEMEKQPYDASRIVTLALGLYQIIICMLPFTTLSIAVATLGHKALNCFMESMVDSWCTYEQRDYPLLAARLRFMMEDRWRCCTFLVVLFLLGTLVLSGFHTDLLVAWPDREGNVALNVWLIIFIDLTFVVVSAFTCSPPGLRLLNSKKDTADGKDGSFLEYFFDTWWRKRVFYIRYATGYMVIALGVFTTYHDGPLRALSMLLETLMYLLIPHVMVHAVLSISIVAVNFHRSVRWLSHHRAAASHTIAFILPYEGVLLYSMYYFRHHWMTVCLLVGVSVLLIYRSIDIAREFEVTEAGSVLWKREDDGTVAPPDLAKVLEEAHENKSRHLNTVSLGVSGDMERMRLISDGKEIPLQRVVIERIGESRSLSKKAVFLAYAFPRVLHAQKPNYLGGKHFRTGRLLLRTITSILLTFFALLVAGVILQAAFPELRKWPVRLRISEGGEILTIDHIVVRMHLLSRNASANPLSPPVTSAMTPAHAAFQWGNTTAFNTDWYASLCAREFHGASVWEVSLLALATYLSTEEEVRQMLHFMNTHMETDWIMRERHGMDCVAVDSSTKPTEWNGYFDFYSAKHDLSVVAIRGTDMTSAIDFLVDFNMFFEVVLYHLLSNFVPGAGILPSHLIADLIGLASLRSDGNFQYGTWESLIAESKADDKNNKLQCVSNNYRRDFFADVYNHIRYIGSRSKRPKHVILTGHSLGGAVASIVGAKMGIQAVGFGAPGITLARKKFNVDLRSINKHVGNIISSHDIFPMIGGNVGEQHRIECLATTRELCHAMEFLVGALWRSCGSIRSRFPSMGSVL